MKKGGRREAKGLKADRNIALFSWELQKYILPALKVAFERKSVHHSAMLNAIALFILEKKTHNRKKNICNTHYITVKREV